MTFIICGSRRVFRVGDFCRTQGNNTVLSAETGAGCECDDIYTGNGVSELIMIAMRALLNNGDEILILNRIILFGQQPLPFQAYCGAYQCDEQADWNRILRISVVNLAQRCHY